MNFDGKTALVGLIGLLMLGVISFLGYYDFAAKFEEKEIVEAEKQQEILGERKKEFQRLEMQLKSDWISLKQSFKDRDYRKARLLLNNFLYVRDNFNLNKKYHKVDSIDARLLKIKKEQEGARERLPAYKKLTYLSGGVYQKDSPLDMKKRKEVWIAVDDKVPNKLVDRLGSKVLLEEQGDFAWITLYVQKASKKQGMAFAIFDLKEGIYTSFLSDAGSK